MFGVGKVLAPQLIAEIEMQGVFTAAKQLPLLQGLTHRSTNQVTLMLNPEVFSNAVHRFFLTIKKI